MIQPQIVQPIYVYLDFRKGRLHQIKPLKSLQEIKTETSLKRHLKLQLLLLSTVKKILKNNHNSSIETWKLVWFFSFYALCIHSSSRNKAGSTLEQLQYFHVLYFLNTPVSFPVPAFWWKLTIILEHSLIQGKTNR